MEHHLPHRADPVEHHLPPCRHPWSTASPPCRPPWSTMARPVGVQLAFAQQPSPPQATCPSHVCWDLNPGPLRLCLRAPFLLDQAGTPGLDAGRAVEGQAQQRPALPPGGRGGARAGPGVPTHPPISFMSIPARAAHAWAPLFGMFMATCRGSARVSPGAWLGPEGPGGIACESLVHFGQRAFLTTGVPGGD